jgi:hypothetical protein
MSLNKNLSQKFALTEGNERRKILLNSQSEKMTSFKSREQMRLKRLEKGKQIIKSITKKLTRKDSLFITEFNGQLTFPTRSEFEKLHPQKPKLKSDVYAIKNYNVFESEDDVINNIMNKFYIHEKVQKPSDMERKRMALDRIYGFPANHSQIMKKAKRKKYLPLDEYQNNILTAFANTHNMEQGKFIDLIQNMKDLRADTEAVAPLPKIKFNIIKDHVLTRGVRDLKQMSIKEYLSKNQRPMDEFEKENMLITKMKSKRYINNTMRNKRNKNLDNLPQYLRDIFNNQIKYHG